MVPFFLLHGDRREPRLAAQLADELLGGIVVDKWNTWLEEVSQSPVGSVLIFLLVFVVRVVMDELSRRRAERRKRKPKHA